MKWQNVSFNDKDIAEKCKNGLAESGIKVGDIFINDEYWCVPWMATSKAEEEAAINIICQYIW